MKSAGVTRLFAALLFVFPLLFIFQGLDFTDMGYNLVSSRDMINDPGNGAGYEMFLSMFIGGLWLKISSSWGLLGARLGAVFVYWAIFVSSFFILKNFMSSFKVLFALFLVLFYVPKSLWISYNNITALLTCLTLLALFTGFKSYRTGFFFLAGILCSLAFFARVPNILMFGFGFLPLCVNMLLDRKINDPKTWKATGFFFIGYLSASILVCLFMFYGGYWEAYAESLLKLIKMSANEGWHHSSSTLIDLFIEDHKRVLSLGMIFAFSGIAIGLFIKKWNRSVFFIFPCLIYFGFSVGWKYYRSSYILPSWFLWLAILGFAGLVWMFTKSWKSGRLVLKNKKETVFLVSFFLVATVFLAASIYYLLSKPRANIFDPVFGLIYIVSTVSLIVAWYQKDRNLLFVLLAGLSMMIVVPLGSGNGIRNANHGMWLSLPLSLTMIKSFSHKRLVNPKNFFKNDFQIVALCIVLLLSVGAAVSYRYTYRDSNNRCEMRFTVDHPKLRGILTTKERARVVQEVLDELQKHVKPGDYLLGYHAVSTLYYLTEARPYLYSSWPFLHEPNVLLDYLKKAEIERPQHPVVLQSKYSQTNFDWPKKKSVSSVPRHKKNRELMRQYLDKNRYLKVWENDLFEIWLPSG